MKIKNDSAIGKAFLAFGQALGLVEGSAEEESVSAVVLTATDGTELNIEREEGEPQVGDAASPDGEWVMDDGKTIVIADGVITEIKEPESEDDEVAALKAEIEQLKQQLNDSQAKVAEQTATLAKMQSSYVPAGRQPNPNNTPAGKQEEETVVSKTSERLARIYADRK